MSIVNTIFSICTKWPVTIYSIYSVKQLCSFIVSQMDEDQFVPIQTVAGFNQIKKLATNIKLIVEAIKSKEAIE